MYIPHPLQRLIRIKRIAPTVIDVVDENDVEKYLVK